MLDSKWGNYMLKERDLRIDNMKGLIILLVILGHTISHTNLEGLNYILYAFIYAFHMPLMMIMSGYVVGSILKRSLNENFTNNFKQLLVPFIAINYLYQLIEYLFLAKPIHANIFAYPTFATWFILCLFVYRLLVKYVVKYKYYLLVSFLIMLCTSFVPEEYFNYYSLYRLFSFQFYFLLGYWLKYDFNLESLVIKSKLKLLIILICAIVINIYIYGYLGDNLDNLYKFDENYKQVLNNRQLFVYLKILSVISTLQISLVIFNLIPRVKTKLCDLGFDSMKYYMYHIFVLFVLDLPFYEHIKAIKSPSLMLVISLISFGLIVFICNRIINFEKRYLQH